MSSPENHYEVLIEAAIMASDRPISVTRLCSIFSEEESIERELVIQALGALQERYQERGIQLKQVASGYRFQVNEDITPRLKKLWETRPQRYSRAFLETLSIIAYKQPLTRGDVENIRGVGVSSSIMRTLLDNDWIKVVGQREVPGRPALYGTTREFLDHFNLKSLTDLPDLPEVTPLPDSQAIKDNLDSEKLDAAHTEIEDGADKTPQPHHSDTEHQEEGGVDDHDCVDAFSESTALSSTERKLD